MLPLPLHQFHRPPDLSAALDLLAELVPTGGSVALMGGGTDVMPQMKNGLLRPRHLVWIGHLGELGEIRERGDLGMLEIGAAVPLARIAADARVRQVAPALAQAAALVAHPQIRNVATLGGNVCLDTRCAYVNQSEFWRDALGYCLKVAGTECRVVPTGQRCVAAHSADTPPVLLVLGAEVELASSRGSRRVPLEHFYVADGSRPTRRADDEVLTAVRIPLRDPPPRSAFRKLRHRSAMDFPLLSVATAAELDPESRVRSLQLCVSGLVARPRLLARLDDLAGGQRVDARLAAAVADRAFRQSRPLPSRHVDLDWLHEMVRVLATRCVLDLAG